MSEAAVAEPGRDALIRVKDLKKTFRLGFFRSRSVEAVKGVSVREGARRLGVARSTLQRWRALARQNPSVEA